MPESYAIALRDSDYLGWVVYVDGSPIYESVPWPNLETPVHTGGLLLPIRHPGRRVMDWDALPHERVQRLELYFAREYLEQPAVRLDREPGHDAVRFLQMKLGAYLVHHLGNGNGRPTRAVERTGIQAYRVGYWDRRRQVSELVEVRLDGDRERLGPVADPCRPKRVLPDGRLDPSGGFGLSPAAVGIRAS